MVKGPAMKHSTFNIQRSTLGSAPWFDLTHEFRAEQNRRKLRANADAFVAGLITGTLMVLVVFLAVHWLTR
jgi:hypothetical protein